MCIELELVDFVVCAPVGQGEQRLEFGHLAPRDVVVKTARRVIRPVKDLKAGQRVGTLASDLRECLPSVNNPAFLRGFDQHGIRCDGEAVGIRLVAPDARDAGAGPGVGVGACADFQTAGWREKIDHCVLFIGKDPEGEKPSGGWDDNLPACAGDRLDEASGSLNSYS